ncbi:hypothetical protein [Citrobacter amalonaticus]
MTSLSPVPTIANVNAKSPRERW